MPKKTVIVTHIYEFTFRVTSEDELDLSGIPVEVERLVEGLLRSRSERVSVGQVDYREMCFDDFEGDSCHLTEGHRGRHEGFSGKRWGGDL